MARTYIDWLNVAQSHKILLDDAIRDSNSKDILYRRGKYLYALKQAEKLNPTGLVPPAVTGAPRPLNVTDVIKTELNKHQSHIDSAIRQNKRDSSIKKMTLSKELSLKIKKVIASKDKLNRASTTAEKDAAKKELTKSSLGLAGAVAKAPVMATAKVASKVGPLAITIAFLPAKVLNVLFDVTLDVYNGTVSNSKTYNNTFVVQMSDCLKDAVKSLSKTTYEAVGRM